MGSPINILMIEIDHVASALKKRKVLVNFVGLEAVKICKEIVVFEQEYATR